MKLYEISFIEMSRVFDESTEKNAFNVWIFLATSNKSEQQQKAGWKSRKSMEIEPYLKVNVCFIV